MSPTPKLQEQLLKIREAAEEREAKRKAKEGGVEYFEITSLPVKVEVLQFIQEERARKLNVAVFEARKPKLALAALNPQDEAIQELIREFEEQGYKVKLFATSERGLEHMWSFYQFTTQKKAPISKRVNIAKEQITKLIEQLKDIKGVEKAISSFDFKNASVTEFLEIYLSGALANNVSDIHLEPSEKTVKLRYRIDGILHDAAEFNKDFYKSVVSRIKLLSNLKINISDKPQDGRFTIGLATKDIEIRVAVAPAEFGEIIVMRVLDPDIINLTLSDLGLRKDDLEIIETELKRPNGMILNTGPTGSGKTTTLYAFLKTKSSSEIKIITIEDPIEYHLAEIEQTQIDNEAGYTFANGLRSIMRQDPDAILIGEVRDKETAEIAIQAALTGHLVFSTIHANEASGVIPRFLDLGVKPTSIGPALNLLIAQRLVRRLCEKCKKSQETPLELKEKFEDFIKKLPKRVDTTHHEITLFKSGGCDACNNSGFKGRIAIFELLLNDPEYEKLIADENHQTLSSEADLEDLIKKGASESEIKKYALDRGMVTLEQDGILKVMSGTTTLEEIETAIGPIHWRKDH